MVFTIYTIPAEDKTYIQAAETPSSEDEDISLHRIYQSVKQPPIHAKQRQEQPRKTAQK